MRIAFLGLGAIGTPMAVHVAKQHQLTVWNRTGTRATAFAAAGQETASWSRRLKRNLSRVAAARARS